VAEGCSAWNHGWFQINTVSGIFQTSMSLMPTPARVLVKAVNWLGDLVMSLPALKALRRTFPEAHLTVLVTHGLASFFDGASYVDEAMPYTLSPGTHGLADRWRIIRSIRARRFDLAVIFPNSFDAALWPALARVPRRVGFSSDARGWLLTHKAVCTADPQRPHQVHSYLQLLHDTLAVDAPAADYAIEVDERHRITMRAWLDARRRRPGNPLIALAPAAAYGPAKEWPSSHYAALIDLLADQHAAECVLVGTPNERGKCEDVAASTTAHPIIAAGETSVGEAVALLSLCDGFAGNDSGCMHVAGALGIPTVGIYGSTDPQRTSPLGPKTAVLHERLECSPCLKRTCRFAHYNCLTRISPSAVVRALYELGALD
jgi:heptosyltransferase II